jgi:hypothetical protein
MDRFYVVVRGPVTGRIAIEAEIVDDGFARDIPAYLGGSAMTEAELKATRAGAEALLAWRRQDNDLYVDVDAERLDESMKKELAEIIAETANPRAQELLRSGTPEERFDFVNNYVPVRLRVV